MLAVNWAIRPVQCLYPAARGKIRVLGAIVANCDSHPVTVLRGPLGSMDRGEKRTSGLKPKHGLHSLKMEGPGDIEMKSIENRHVLKVRQKSCDRPVPD
jgi:hypothetical protein